MAGTLLCERCSKIDFASLRYPTISDIKSIQAGNVPEAKYPFKQHTNLLNGTFNLGFLSELRRRDHCKLCMCIWDRLKTLEAPVDLSTFRRYSDSGHAPLGQEVTVKAAVHLHWGLFRYNDDEDRHCTLYRLSITTHISPNHEYNQQAHMLLDHYFQVCDVGAGEIEIDDNFRDPREETDMTVFGGRKRPLQVNVNWLERWLSICEKDHGTVCNATLSLGDGFKMETVRFIDVQGRRLRTFNNKNLLEIQYIALSYVWGKDVPNAPSVLELNASTILELEKKGALDKLHIPQTMTDLLELANILNVPKMHAIYNASFITVVAAAGNDVHHGLPGLRPGTRQVEQHEIPVLSPCPSHCMIDHVHDPKGMSLITSVSGFLREEHYLEGTTWNRRGWTMQERVLARRSLIFTDEQVYWACSDATFSEDSFCESSFPRFQFFSRRPAELNLKNSTRTYTEHRDPKERSWDTFSLLVKRYSQRLLTFEGDGYDAFAAILQALQADSEEEFIWGIPVSFFEIGLSWTTFDGQYRRTEPSTLPMTALMQNVQFPSWSWIGWIGEAHVTVGKERLESDMPTIKCYVHESSAKGITIVPASDFVDDSSLQDQSLKWAIRVPRVVTMAIVEEHLPNITTKYLATVPRSHLLFFWTSSARFRLHRPLNINRRSYLRDPVHSFVCISCETVNQHVRGLAAPTAPTLESARSHFSIPDILDNNETIVGSTCRMDNKHWERGAYDTGEHEFLVIGRRHIAELGDAFPATLLVMQVERKGDVCYRVNMGEIEESAWEQAVSEWSLIVLG